jgi:predicted phosphate transport protein (TIGR00153 family)
MRFRIRPVESSFYDMFSEAAAHLVDGAALLAQMLDDTSDKAAIAERMREAEHEADETTHKIVRRVNSTFITPFDREDIYRLAGSLDDVMDFMEECVDLLGLYELEALPPEFAPQVEVLQRATQLTAEAMPRLRTMKDLSDYWIEVNRLENEADKLYRRLLSRLYSGEFDALEILKLKEVADQLEEAADAFEHVANVVETIAVKES